MKISVVVLTAALAGQAVATWGFGKAAYNKWHETELERWLSDHNIPYKKSTERKDLEQLVQDNWQTKVVDSYRDWPEPQLQSYLSDAGHELDMKQKDNKNWLLEKVKGSWHETEKTAETAYGSVKDWIFDSWSVTALSSFLDRHSVPQPQPPTRPSLIETAKNNFNNVATKLGETASYPGNWLYESWTEQDLKTWLKEHGYPVPKKASRDDLISSVRRNSRWASVRAKSKADKAANSVSDSVFDSWNESKLKDFLNRNNVKIPQGSTKNELLALARRNKAYYVDDSASSISSGYNAATSSVGSAAASATDSAHYHGQAAFDTLVSTWSDSRLKAFLDSRGVPVPQASKRDELLAKVRLHKHKAATGYGAWTFDTWTYDNLKSWLEARGQKVSTETTQSRDALLKQATDYYNSVSASAASAANQASATGSKATGAAADAANKAGDYAADTANKATDSAASAATAAASGASSAASGAASAASSGASAAGEYATDAGHAAYASVTSAIAEATSTAKSATFDTWSDSDLKSYLDTYGIKTYQGTTRNELIAQARSHSHAFLHGSQDQGVMGQIKASVWGVGNQIKKLVGLSKEQADVAAVKAGAAAKDASVEASSAYAKATAKGEL